jgi:hypothetical protein
MKLRESADTIGGISGKPKISVVRVLVVALWRVTLNLVAELPSTATRGLRQLTLSYHDFQLLQKFGIHCSWLKVIWARIVSSIRDPVERVG